MEYIVAILIGFDFGLIEKLCHFFQVRIRIIYSNNNIPFEQELSQDIIMLMTVFSARYYGKEVTKIKSRLDLIRFILYSKYYYMKRGLLEKRPHETHSNLYTCV